MVDIGLYGNLIVDRIIDNFTETHRLGGIANSWEALTYLSPNKKVQLVPTSIGEALILVDKKSSRRSSRARMNIDVNNCEAINAAWHHIMYLNSVHDLSFLKDVVGVISADITTGSVKNLEWLNFVDYLFVSDEDLFMDFDELTNLTKGWVILHNSTGSICSNGETRYNMSDVVSYIDGINVLGAGDIFASAFIGADNSIRMPDRIKKSHIETSNLLKVMG